MAATSVITCPECAKKFKGREGLQGKKVRCPGCGHSFIVEMMAKDKVDSADDDADDREPAAAKPRAAAKSAKSAKPAPPPPAPPPAAEAKPKDALDDEFDADGNPYGVTTLDMRPRCPNCAEEMESDTALICLHCGYNTQTRRLGKTEKTIADTGGEQFMWLLPGLACALGFFLLFVVHLFNCFVVPDMVDHKTWTSLFDSEALRLWIGLILIGLMWPLGYFAHKRLIYHPKPPEKVME